MNIENRLESLEQKIASLESTIEKLMNGNFEQISTNKIIIKQKENESSYYDEDLQDTGIFIYDKNDSLLYKTFIHKNAVRTVFYGIHNDEVVEFGLCEHGAGRLVLNNINGENLFYLGTVRDENNHSARLNLYSQDQSGQIHLTTSNSDDEEKYLTDIMVNQKDDNNDESNLISFGIDKNNESGKDIAKILMITDQDGTESIWVKKSTDKF
jgi:hypothetical protein|tara:strand:- start:94 stop:726 length:633 start_codon:yes stop_codon:yes gene_type:complete